MTVRSSHSAHRSRWVACPECEHEFRIHWNTNIRRCRAKRFRCSECDFVGPRGKYTDPFEPKS